MKKILFSCLLALGIGANAQYNYTGSFEESDVSFYAQFGTGTITTAAACTGTNGGQIAPTATTTQTGWMMMLKGTDPANGDIGLEDIDPTQSNNSQAATVTIKYKKASGPVGTLYLALFQYDATADSWNITPIVAGVALTSAAVTTCTTITGTIPAGVMEAGKIYGVGGFYVRSSGTGNVYIDDISIVQNVVTTAPSCTPITAPANGSTIGYGTTDIVWTAAPTASSYKLTVGTTSGGSDVFNGVITGGITDKYVPTSPNTTYFAKVVPTNTSGDATGCTEISFNTNSSIGYCTSSSPVYTNTGYEIISGVKFADINNTSPTVANTPGYEDWTSVVGHVKTGLTYPLSVTIKGFDNAGDKTIAWIDYNQDGIFADSEKIVLTNAATSTANVTIPNDAKLGNTRMRISLDYGTTAPESCDANSYGQVEDYTINIQQLQVPSCVSITAPADASTGVTTPSATLTWAADPNAAGYKVYLGTTPGGTNVINGTLVATTSQALTGLAKNTTYFAKIVPTNSLGDATGCTGTSFTTAANFTYCTATHSTVNSDRMSNVSFADINNPSTLATVTGGYEDFTSVTGNVEASGTNTMTVTLASGNANDRVGVWVDSNNNGTFETGEFTLLTTTGTTSAAGSVAIPSGATLGNTRMRIRLQRSATGPGSGNACGNLTSQGRTQDYTLKIVPAGTLAVSDVNKANISVYPNPFSDVLKISDVKGVKSISVNDISGREIKSLNPSTELNLSSLKAGLYIVNLKMEDGSIKSFKAIKK